MTKLPAGINSTNKKCIQVNSEIPLTIAVAGSGRDAGQTKRKTKARAIALPRTNEKEIHNRLVLYFILLLTVLVVTGFSAFRVHAQQNEDVYEIIRSTEDRIWRLNKQTGEVSVCTLAGDNLVCTNTDDAAVPPSKTYEDIKEEEAAAEAQRKAEIEAAEAERKAEQRAEQERQLNIIDRILDMFRELVHMSMEEPGSTSD